MKKQFSIALIAVSFVLGGCAAPPQQPIALSSASLPAEGAKVGVAMSPIPNPDTYFPGANCLLCMGAASVANSSLTNHTHTLPTDDLAKMKGELADLLRKKGQKVTVIDDAIKVDDLPKFEGGPNKARRDFSSLRAKYGIDKLVMVNITQVGMTRNYSSFVPTGAPQGTVEGVAYLLNLNDNSYEWFAPLHQVTSAAGEWDEAPQFPGLSNAYFQAVEGTRDAVLQPFAK